MNLFRIMNTINPMNMNYQLNQENNSINKINNAYGNGMNINKKFH